MVLFTILQGLWKSAKNSCNWETIEGKQYLYKLQTESKVDAQVDVKINTALFNYNCDNCASELWKKNSNILMEGDIREGPQLQL